MVRISNNLIAVLIIIFGIIVSLNNWLIYKSADQLTITGLASETGEISLKIIAKDAGDNTPPKINITKLGPTTARNITVTGSYSDDSSIRNITVEVNSSQIVPANIDTDSLTWSAFINLTEGWNHFNVLAYDVNDNFANVSSSSQEASILLDTTAPSINLTSVDNNSKLANNSLLIFTVEDLYLSDDVFYSLNDGQPISFNSIYEHEVLSPPWIDGTNYFIVNATDLTNNVIRQNYTFTYLNTYGIVLEASISVLNKVIDHANDTLNNLQDPDALNSLVSDLAAEISVQEYNNTLEALGILTNLSNAISTMEKLLQEILDANSTNQENATKKATINAKLKQLRIIRNTTIKSVNVNLFDTNLTVDVGIITKRNVTDELAAAVSGLSATDKLNFEQASEVLQNKTTIVNKVQKLPETLLNGRRQNVTLFEKNITINETQSGEFYINEFIDKNITGNNDLNADADVINLVPEPMTVVVADPLVRWSFSDTAGVVIKYTINKNVDSTKNVQSKTVITTVPTTPALAPEEEAAAAAPSAAAAGGGGGGIGAGAIIDNILKEITQFWSSISRRTLIIVNIDDPNIAITKLGVLVNTNLNDVEIKVASLKDKPTKKRAALRVYQYDSIINTNIKDSQTDKITISFRVPKTWLSENNLEAKDIGIFRYNDGEWNQLTSKIIGSDVNYTHYEAITPGFSYYAFGVGTLIEQFTVEKEIIKIVLEQSERKTFYFKLKNAGNDIITVTIDTDLAEYISFEDKVITLKPGEEKEVSFNVRVEDSPNVYLGKIFLISDFLEKEIELILEVHPAFSLFDVKVLVQKQYKQVNRGQIVAADIALVNLGETKEATLFYSIRDLNNEDIVSKEEMIFIKEPVIISRELKLPDDIKADKYFFYVSLTSGSDKEFATDVFEVVKKPPIEFFTRFSFLIRLLIIFVLVTLLAITYYNFILYKKKIKISPKKMEKIAAKRAKIQEKLDSLAEAYNSGFIRKKSYENSKKELEDIIKNLNER